MKPGFYLILPALYLLSCASAPKKHDVDIGVVTPENWAARSSVSGAGDSLWWREFKDEKLVAIIDEAFSRNHNLRIAAHSLRSALAQARIAGAPLYPQVGLSLDAARRKQNFIGFPIPGAEDEVLSRTNSTYGVALNVSWEVDLWGKLRAGQAAAVAEWQASRADYRGATLSLTGQVCKAWFATIEARRQVELAAATVENQRVSTEQVQLRYESGLTTSLDYRLALSNYARAEAAMFAREVQFDQTIRQLEVLLGRYPNATVELSFDLPEIKRDIPSGLPAQVLSRRPDLVAAERRLAARHEGIRNARAALLPQISLTASGGTSTDELKNLLSGDFSVWNLVGNILQPIFQGGRLRANVDLAESSADMAVAQYGLSVLNAFAEVEVALTGERLLAEREAALQVATDQAIAARQLAEEQYAGGIRDFITMLETQRSAYETESQLLSVRRERLDARIDLHLALGGNFASDSKNEDQNGVQ
jgi:NodT family efflux transporter outer membrane factor (OMF) lipoprotein